ncbi:MAG: transporter, partial [Candidatus Binatia bacterium]
MTVRKAFGAAARVAVSSVAFAGGAAAFDAQQFSPAVDPQGYFSVYSSRTAPAGRYHLAVWYNFANDPVWLDAFRGEDLGERTKIVDELHTIDVVASYSVLDWLEVGIDLPISDVSTDLEGEVRTGTGIDDLRLVGKMQVLDNLARTFGLAFVPFLDLPTGEEERLTANGDVDYGFLVVADVIVQRFHASANVGYKVNDEAFDDSDESDEILFGLGAGALVLHDVPILGGLFRDVEVMAEIFGASAEQNAFDFADELNHPVEGLGGVRLFSPGGFYFGAGVGKSVTKSVNGAGTRVVATLGYTPPPPPPPPAA